MILYEIAYWVGIMGILAGVGAAVIGIAGIATSNESNQCQNNAMPQHNVRNRAIGIALEHWMGNGGQ